MSVGRRAKIQERLHHYEQTTVACLRKIFCANKLPSRFSCFAAVASSCFGCWYGLLPVHVALNIYLLATFVGDVELQGGSIPRQSPDPGKGFNRSDEPRLR